MGAIKSRIGPFEGRDHASLELSLRQRQPTLEDLRLARGPPPATDTPSACPRPSLHQEAPEDDGLGPKRRWTPLRPTPGLGLGLSPGR
jgi:hypothetical protein